MSYYRRPYYVTMLGRPYLSTLPISSDYLSKREYSYEYSTPGGKDYDLYDYDYLYPRRRYYPVYDWSPTDYKYDTSRSYLGRSTPYYSPTGNYYPDYRTTISTPYGLNNRFSDTITKTVTRVGPYGTTTRTYRY